MWLGLGCAKSGIYYSQYSVSGPAQNGINLGGDRRLLGMRQNAWHFTFSLRYLPDLPSDEGIVGVEGVNQSDYFQLG